MKHGRKIFAVCLLSMCFSIHAASSDKEQAEGLPHSPSKGMVTMVDLGARECIPCKLMEPIIKELREEYKGKASILFIDVWKNTNEVEKYGIRVIPTQIFFDRDGKEVYRHEGFMDKKSIVSMLRSLGVEP